METDLMKEKIYAFWLCHLAGCHLEKRKALLAHFHSARKIYEAKRCQLGQAVRLSSRDLDQILASKGMERIMCEYDKMERRGIHFVFEKEQHFPERLRQMEAAPYGLFYRGRLPDPSLPAVAVVGARKASVAGKSIAEKFGYELAANGIQVISGMALGIDISSQRGALKVPLGHTYAVLGTGVDVCYPRCHLESYMEIQKEGGIISEFPPGTPALPYHFPIRNRIISGLSDGVLVIEAKKGSGSLITAEYGLEQGKEIFVVPGSLGDPLYEGGNELLKSGAVLVTEVRDILDGLGIFLDEDIVERKKKTNIMLETTEKMVYAILSLEPVSVSTLMENTGLGLQELIEALISLQTKKLIRPVGNHRFVARI